MLALQKTLAGVTGFEPAKTGFGDQRPSHRVLTPPPQRAKVARRAPRTVAVATGVEPVPPDRQSGLLPLDSATTFNLPRRSTASRNSGSDIFQTASQNASQRILLWCGQTSTPTQSQAIPETLVAKVSLRYGLLAAYENLL